MTESGEVTTAAAGGYTCCSGHVTLHCAAAVGGAAAAAVGGAAAGCCQEPAGTRCWQLLHVDATAAGSALPIFRRNMLLLHATAAAGMRAPGSPAEVAGGQLVHALPRVLAGVKVGAVVASPSPELRRG